MNASVGRWSPQSDGISAAATPRAHERSLLPSFSAQIPKEYSLAGAFGVEFPPVLEDKV